jgi:Zn finger protein HypA/HybF involved in hydrogenase expression
MARQERTIKCDACGYPYRTRRMNTKRCRVCQLIQRLSWLGNRTTECDIPPKHFFVALDGHDKVCGEHDLLPKANDAEGECKQCGKHTTKLVHDTVHLCRACITNPDLREEVLHKLRLKQAWQVKHADAAWTEE